MKSAHIIFIAVVVSACELKPVDWGFEKMRTMKTPADPELKCGNAIPADTLADKRTACTFKATSHASESLGIPTSVSNDIPIRHVIVMMKENRSFDHLFAKLHDLQPEVEAIPPTFTNPDDKGEEVAPFHATTTCNPLDPGHQSASMRACLAGGTMRGFVKNAAATTESDGHWIMSTYDQTDLPFYYWLANTYAVSDRHFAPMVSGTFGNRNFFMFGTNVHVVDTGISYADPSTNSIFRTLMNAGYTWGTYADETPLSATLNWTKTDPGAHSIEDLYKALDEGTLPNVAFVDAVDSVDDDHPPADLHVGEVWLKKLYEHAVKSPQWGRTAIIWTYDEGGGYPDHVVPPSACQSSPTEAPFTEMGVRIPLIAISPWAKRHAVSHTVHDHTAITRFIETIFDLPALTARDANSDALMDLFDFSCGRDLTPPTGVPEPGPGSCTR